MCSSFRVGFHLGESGPLVLFPLSAKPRRRSLFELDFDQLHSEASSEAAEVCLCSGGRLRERELHNAPLFPPAAAQILRYVTRTEHERSGGGSGDACADEEFPEFF